MISPKTLFRISVRQHPRPAPFHGGRLRVLVRRALSSIAPEAADIRILVVEDSEMTKWNSEFLGRHRTTNVISFPEEDPPGGVHGKRAHPSVLAGDILVSAPTCLRQTAAWPGSPEERVLYFIIHGILHLAGYDHERGAKDARRMRAAEEKLYRLVMGEYKARGI